MCDIIITAITKVKFMKVTRIDNKGNVVTESVRQLEDLDLANALKAAKEADMDMDFGFPELEPIEPKKDTFTAYWESSISQSIINDWKAGKEVVIHI
jgi:hypothetical protein